MSVELIKGITFGIELLEDEDDVFLCIELFIIRIMVDLKGKL